MTEWTTAYCEVGNQARRFFEAKERMGLCITRGDWQFCLDLAIARMDLECALAVYRNLRNRETA